MLRPALGPEPIIYILGGFGRDETAEYTAHDLRPVLNSAGQARAWFTDHPGRPAAVQLDTGMNRLGMEVDEFAGLGPLPEAVTMIMSHMGNADDPPHSLNGQQLATFRELTGNVALTRSGIGGTFLPHFRFHGDEAPSLFDVLFAIDEVFHPAPRGTSTGSPTATAPSAPRHRAPRGSR